MIPRFKIRKKNQLLNKNKKNKKNTPVDNTIVVVILSNGQR